MPETLSQASPGGTSPRTIKNDQILNIFTFEVPKQHHLHGGLNREKGKVEQGQEERMSEEEVWVGGAKEEDNERYRNFLTYMEEKREEARQHLPEERDRKRDAKKKEESWALMREAVAFLRTNDEKWREKN